jgi:cell division septation protein DedD
MSVGGCAKPVFPPEAIEKIFNFSQGVPRLVNQFAGKALLAAYVDGAKTVRPDHIEEEQTWAEQLIMEVESGEPTPTASLAPPEPTPTEPPPVQTGEPLVPPPAAPAAPSDGPMGYRRDTFASRRSPRTATQNRGSQQAAGEGILGFLKRLLRRRVVWGSLLILLLICCGLLIKGRLTGDAGPQRPGPGQDVAMLPGNQDPGTRELPVDHGATTSSDDLELPPDASAGSDNQPSAGSAAAASTTEPVNETPVTADPPASQAGYSLHVASFKDLARAQVQIANFQKAGLPAFSRESLIKGARWTRIYLGPYATEQQAKSKARTFKREGLIDYFKVVRLEDDGS